MALACVLSWHTIEIPDSNERAWICLCADMYVHQIEIWTSTVHVHVSC